MAVRQVTGAKGAFELVEREISEPGPGSVRVRVKACGICPSDFVTKEGIWPGIQFPRAPGHEVAGIATTIEGTVPAYEVMTLPSRTELRRFNARPIIARSSGGDRTS